MAPNLKLFADGRGLRSIHHQSEPGLALKFRNTITDHRCRKQKKGTHENVGLMT